LSKQSSKRLTSIASTLFDGYKFLIADDTTSGIVEGHRTALARSSEFVATSPTAFDAITCAGIKVLKSPSHGIGRCF
jgi:hypothetical protein